MIKMIQLKKFGMGLIFLTRLYSGWIKTYNILTLVDIDAHIKVIYIDFSHIKLLNCPKYWSHIYKTHSYH